MTSFFKYVVRFALLTFAVIVFYFLCAFILSVIPSSRNEILAAKNNAFYLQSDGTHLEIVVPVSSLDSAFKQELQVPVLVKFVSFGWGNKEFYFNVPEWKDLTFGLAFRAVFFRLQSAMHVRFYSFEKESWKKIAIAEIQLKNLNYFIENSFSKKENALLLCKKNELGNNCFYDAKGKYSFINTCNVWVNDALKQANIPTSVWSPFHWGVLYHLE